MCFFCINVVSQRRLCCKKKKKKKSSHYSNSILRGKFEALVLHQLGGDTFSKAVVVDTVVRVGVLFLMFYIFVESSY